MKRLNLGRGPFGRQPNRSTLVQRLRQEPGSDNLHFLLPAARKCQAIRDDLRSISDVALIQHIRQQRFEVLVDTKVCNVSLLAGLSELAHRQLGLEPFEVQILAAISMLQGYAIDMATGEGKTLVGLLAATHLAMAGHRVHILSANSYLAKRDAESASQLCSSLQVSARAVTDSMDDDERRAAYCCALVYTTAQQVGFDLLRDRQNTVASQRLVPPLDAALVDELDAILLDDALVPLVLAAETDPQTDPQTDCESLSIHIAKMRQGVDYVIDGERHNASFTESGIARIESALGIANLYDSQHTEALVAATLALHAEVLLQRDVHYIVLDDRIVLISSARGRIADRQRWPDGLQAAVERKEGLRPTPPAEIIDQTLVETVVRGYDFLTGMSGTAFEAAERLAEDLDIRTGVIPTNRPCARIDEPDLMYITQDCRDRAAAARILKAHSTGQPVLIGTRSVEESERFSQVLTECNIQAVVLNAKNDAQEAEIVAHAGRPRGVTISTQMAGRGVDIRLQGSAAEAGGLLVLGLGRYESARIDQQLRGRAGRQGDPGRSVFYTSLEDHVVTEHLSINIIPRTVDADGLIRDRRFADLYGHAQRVAEGKVMRLHRTTRGYHRATDHHRDILLKERERIAADDGATRAYLAKLWQDDPAQGIYWASPERQGLATAVILYYMDRKWTEHLGYLAEVREGIHLRALGRQNPLDEFNLVAASEFGLFASRVQSAVRDRLAHADEDAKYLEDLGLRRPSSTWTYMVTDNPFGSEVDRIVAFASRKIRGGRPRGVDYT